jgi:hypothetical protein
MIVRHLNIWEKTLQIDFVYMKLRTSLFLLFVPENHFLRILYLLSFLYAICPHKMFTKIFLRLNRFIPLFIMTFHERKRPSA